MFQSFHQLRPEKKPFVYAAIGAALGLILVLLGFWRTLIVAFFAVMGYFLGAIPNKADYLRNMINKKFPPKDQ